MKLAVGGYFFTRTGSQWNYVLSALPLVSTFSG